MATNVRVAMLANDGKQVVKEINNGDVLRVDGATNYSFEVNGHKGLPAGTKIKRSAAGVTLEFADQTTLELAGVAAAEGAKAVDMAAVAQQLADSGSISSLVDAADFRMDSLGKIESSINDVVQHAVEGSVGAAAVITSGEGAGAVAAGLSLPAAAGIGLGVVAVGAAAGGGGGSSSSAGATPSGVGDPPAPGPAPAPAPVSGTPTAKLAAASDSGTVGDATTNDSTPTIEGTGTAGDAITVTTSTGQTLNTVVGADGTWSVTAAALADGNVTFSVVEMAPGAVTASAPVVVALKIDTVQATPAAPDMTDATDTGSLNNDNITSNHLPAFFLGNPVAGETPELFIDGSATPAAGTYNSATGVFTTTAAIADGTHYATQWVHDAAGNTSAPSDGIGFTIQQLAITSVTDNQGTITGTLSAGASTDDTTPTLAGTLTGPLAGVEHLSVLRDGVAVGNATVNGALWTFNDGEVPVGDHSYTVQVVQLVDGVESNAGSASAAFSMTALASGTLGGTGADTLTGDPGSNDLWGGAGADQLIGGPGTDYARYDFATSAVTANLANSALNTGEAAGDTYTSIEGLHGTGYNDTLVGDANVNVMFGHDGNDTISLGAGDDYVLGGRGSDTLTGGAGNDTFAFSIASADPKQTGNADVIKDFHSVVGDFDVINLDGLLNYRPGAAPGTVALNTNDGTIDLTASVSGADLLLSFHDATAGTDYSITLEGRFDLYHNDSFATLNDLANAGQLNPAQFYL